MPVISKNSDQLEFWARYLIYAREPFSFPIGLVKRLGFPFQITTITRGPVELFAIFFKLLSKIYAPFAEFYYFVLFELLCAFLTGYFTCLLLDSFRVKSFWLKLLGVTLVSLSFPFLFRSSHYYAIPSLVVHFPIYLIFAYFYIRLYKYPNWKPFFLLLIFFLILAFFCDYPTLVVYFVFFICICFNFFEFMVRKTEIVRKRLFFSLTVFILGIASTIFVLNVLGQQGNYTVPWSVSPLANRQGRQWGYGGGFGGGFHVADALTFFIPPQDDDKVPEIKRCGPTAYLTKWGLPITTNNLQDGQYEGFTFLGTTAIGILFFLIIMQLFSLIKNSRLYLMKMRLKWMYQLFTPDNIFSLPFVLGVCAFVLYIFSLGYIIHFLGFRLNHIATPALVLAEWHPRFMLVRSLGRLAVPLMQYITIACIISLNQYLYKYLNKSTKPKKLISVLIIISLIIFHISEIQGYLKPPEVTRGNEIANLFGKDDRILIKKLLQDKRALIVVPKIRGGIVEWDKLCYSLAFYSDIPLSGASSPMGNPIEYLRQYDSDTKNISEGNIKEITNRYGNIAIAAPSAVAEKILNRADVPLKPHKLHNQDAVILTLD